MSRPTIGWKLLTKSMESPFAERYGGVTIHYPVGEWVEVPGHGAYVAGLPGSYVLTAGGSDDPARLLLCRMEVFGEGGPAWQTVRNLGPVTSQTSLARIAREDTAWYVRTVAIRRIEDPAILTRIEREEEDCYVREVASQRLAAGRRLRELAPE